MGTPHILAIPCPIQGHINPLMQLSHVLAKHGCKITFVHTEFTYKRANIASTEQHNLEESHIKFMMLPDGLDPEDDRSDFLKVSASIRSTMPDRLPKLIEDSEITCVLVTISMGWALEVAHKLGIRGALFCPASATSLASLTSIPTLIHDGIIDSQGRATKNQEIKLSPNMPLMDTEDFPWNGFSKLMFDRLAQEMQTLELGEWWLCNTTNDLEPGAFSISPKILPIGPLMSNESNNISSFWQEDTTCLQWLDQQPPQSVVYVAFGSLATIEQNQFQELALALDLLNKPFLWVVRPSNDNKGNNNAYPHDFVGSKGKIVAWAPQKKILNHPSIACFISHCGWNSTLDGVCGGVPFLCWPFFGDQKINKSYICDVWKVGFGLDKDENGLISRGEIRKKVEKLVGDKEVKSRSLKLKETTIYNALDGGHSSKNLDMFIKWASNNSLDNTLLFSF
ncbi:hypothetical protein RJT34_18356 [Clitoria ternatea]|uniref:Glycosyltransferase N-terminal domain-containing protein n=1 Tax=Clitoria ternatea TaxID=43366 RepID=A0AAN9JBD8_CLITE